VGKGKLERFASAPTLRGGLVIFDNDLSPSQIREIEKATGRKVPLIAAN